MISIDYRDTITLSLSFGFHIGVQAIDCGPPVVEGEMRVADQATQDLLGHRDSVCFGAEVRVPSLSAMTRVARQERSQKKD